MRILIVDDSPKWQSKIRGVMIRAFPGAEILKAQNETEAHAHLVTGHPNLITMDGHFSAPSAGEQLIGPFMVRELRRAGVTCPIIMISGDPEARELGLMRGASAACSKENLREGLQRVLQDLKLIT